MMAISEVLHRGRPLTKSSKALLLLHGRGGTAQSILQLADKLVDDSVYIAAPQAFNHIWYPYSLMEEDKLNEPYLSQSVRAIKDLIDKTAQHIPLENIFIAGFSQGACLSLEVSSRFATKYGGIAAFTGGLIGYEINEKKYQGDFAKTKVFISNGDLDPYIPLIRSKESEEIMKKLNADVTLKVYKGRSHIITEDELKHVRNMILGED